MIGSWLWNAWFSLAGFSYYFFLTFLDKSPKSVLMGSVCTAVIFYLLMFGFRMVLSYFFSGEIQSVEEMDIQVGSTGMEEHSSSEELANLVKSLLHEDEHKTS
ncbi:hypothetical protein [Mangrovibacillus cuniculi]|uniref:Uncharacterized protein n=1 Tax=Mangrovibacillus cuniculi TaxID=2593652 RepID=A0A7S8CAH1_9BACI|nr:hypothetical protein [Mangrovibacillus cuniculi]QPC46368.1 hypothetical protein G8O30_05005 [Mangrovibacillus cuniculi]